MYVTPGALFLIGIGIGALVSLVTIVGMALYADSKSKKENK